MREYDDNTELYRYVYQNYHNLGHEYVWYLKMANAESSEMAEMIKKRYLKGRFQEIHDQISGLRIGDATIVIGKIIFENNRDKIFIQRCDKCNKIVATPVAEQCCWCGHEWRGLNPLLREWDANR